MERITVSLESDLIKEFDDLIHRHGYQNRSEALRDLLRSKINEIHLQNNQTPYCVANVSYIYKHAQHDLTERLIGVQHAAHRMVMANCHIHLDQDSCMETLLLRGQTDAVRHIAHAIIAERGVQYGNFSIMPAKTNWIHAVRHSAT